MAEIELLNPEIKTTPEYPYLVCLAKLREKMSSLLPDWKAYFSEKDLSHMNERLQNFVSFFQSSIAAENQEDGVRREGGGKEEGVGREGGGKEDGGRREGGGKEELVRREGGKEEGGKGKEEGGRKDEEEGRRDSRPSSYIGSERSVMELFRPREVPNIFKMMRGDANYRKYERIVLKKLAIQANLDKKSKKSPPANKNVSRSSKLLTGEEVKKREEEEGGKKEEKVKRREDEG